MANRLLRGASIRNGQSEPDWFREWALLSGILSNPEVIEYYDGYVFMASRSTFISIALDKFSNPTLLDSINIFVPYSSPTVFDMALSEDGSTAYIANYTNGVVQIVDISDPSNLTLGSIVVFSGLFSGLCVNGNYLYSCHRGNRLIAWDISTPTSPSYLSEISGPSSVAASSYFVKSNSGSNYLYITSYNNDKIGKVNISNPNAISTTGSLTDSINLNGVYDIALHSNDQVAFVCSLITNSVISLDIAGTNPSILDVLNLSYACLRLDVKGDFVHVLSYAGDRLFIVDASNPSSLSLERTFTTLDEPRDLIIPNELTYIAEQGTTNGVRIIKGS